MQLDRFEQLMPEFERVYLEREAQRKSRLVKTGRERQRKPGGGAQFSTKLQERLLMLLLYYRLYLTQEFMTLLFELEDKATISRAIRQVRPVFEAVLPVPERARRSVVALAEEETNRRGKRIGKVEDFAREYPELSILIDGTEQPKRRPQNPKKRQSDYSGKKKPHTPGQIITATSKGIILDQSPSVGGRCHDFRAFKAHLAQDWLGGAGYMATARHWSDLTSHCWFSAFSRDREPRSGDQRPPETASMARCAAIEALHGWIRALRRGHTLYVCE